MKTTNEKLNTEELEVLEWLKEQPKTEEVLKKIEELEPIDWDSDPEFVANFAKGQITEDILKAMEEDNINKSQLAEKLGKSRQYVSRVLNETANFTIDSLAEIACALQRKVEARIIKKNKHLVVSADYVTDKKSSTLQQSGIIDIPVKKSSKIITDGFISDVTTVKNEGVPYEEFKLAS